MPLANYYHDAFEYEPEYQFETKGKAGIPATTERIVCPTCNGNGNHFRKDLDENEMIKSIQEDGDEDSMEAYQSGAFNQICTECNGRNVIDQVNFDNLPQWAIDSINEYNKEESFNEQVRFAENGYQY
jgi:hypothetical protein